MHSPINDTSVDFTRRCDPSDIICWCIQHCAHGCIWIKYCYMHVAHWIEGKIKGLCIWCWKCTNEVKWSWPSAWRRVSGDWASLYRNSSSILHICDEIGCSFLHNLNNYWLGICVVVGLVFVALKKILVYFLQKLSWNTVYFRYLSTQKKNKLKKYLCSKI